MKAINFNPVSSIGEQHYAEIWQKLFATLLQGFWAKVIFLTLIAISIYFSLRRRNPRVAMITLGMALVIAYGASFLSKLFGITP